MGVRSLGHALGIMGHEVLLAFDGTSALAEAAPMVLLDIDLPDYSGYEVCRRMLDLPRMSEATLLAQTGWGQAIDKRRAIEAGFQHHWTKPVELERIRQLLAKD